MDLLTCHFPLIFFPFVGLRHHVPSYNPFKNKSLWPLQFPAVPGEEQTLSDISAGRQGGRFFPTGWRLPPCFQNTPLPKSTPSWASGTKGAAWHWASAHAQSLPFPSTPSGLGMAQGLGIHTTKLRGAWLGLGVALFSSLALLVHPPKPTARSDFPETEIQSLLHPISEITCNDLLVPSKDFQSPAWGLRMVSYKRIILIRGRV